MTLITAKEGRPLRDLGDDAIDIYVNRNRRPSDSTPPGAVEHGAQYDPTRTAAGRSRLSG